MSLRRLLLVSALLLLAGCAAGWVRPGTSPAQAHQDDFACQVEAWGKYPHQNVHIDSDSLREPSKDVDANSTIRDEEQKYCMRQQGYAFQRL